MEKNNAEHVQAAIEALLFCYGEPLSIKKIATYIAVNETSIVNALEAIRIRHVASMSGIALITHNDMWQLVTKKEHAALLQKLANNECNGELTSAARETFAIVAYHGPINQTAIDEIRGVNAAVSIRNLLVRGLIEKKTHAERVEEYDISTEGLRKLGVQRREELPEYETYRKLKST